MYIFCVFWVPMFFLFRRSIAGGGGAGGMLALIAGSIAAFIQFFLGDIVEAGEFGVSRWLSAFVDVVGLPVLIPFFAYSFFIIFKSFSGNYDFANFILIWMIPVAGLKALKWVSVRSPLVLVMVPLLWTALAMGLSLFVHCILRSFRWYVVIFSVIGIAALSFAAVTSYWALFSQQTMLGYALFAASMIPMTVSVIMDYVQAR
jgi:hypothetical protein